MNQFSLPLFPLNMVLFPGVPIFLHIFEDRYREMINLCITERRPFGVVLIDEGVEAHGSATPHQIGCSAEIVNVQRMDDGRMNIAAVGQERFQILDTNNDAAYLQGDVQVLPLDVDASKGRLQKYADTLKPRMETYVETLREIAEVQVNWDGIPEDPIELAHMAAYVLQVTPERKQYFLEQESVTELYSAVLREYRIEQQLLDMMITQRRLHPSSADSDFGLN